MKEKQALIKTHRYKNDTAMRPMVNHDQFLSNKYIETNVSIVAQVKVELGVAKRHKLKIEVIRKTEKYFRHFEGLLLASVNLSIIYLFSYRNTNTWNETRLLSITRLSVNMCGEVATPVR